MILLLSLLVSAVTGILDEGFLSFVKRRYGPTIANQLNRADLGPNGDGSFGGGLATRKYRPIVMVHGLRNKAGYLWRNRKVFQDNGWAGEHIYATSWGKGDQGLFEGLNEGLKCEHVKQIRYMILAVVHYYKSDVDVITFSMGSPLTRKAILGGHCVDTNEYIGGAITHHINTYLSVAGANHGSALCNFAFPGICGLDIGLNCFSAFLKNINSQFGYEGKHRYSIYSDTDEALGVINGCGQKVCEIKNAESIILKGLNHWDTEFKALSEQVMIIKKHS